MPQIAISVAQSWLKMVQMNPFSLMEIVSKAIVILHTSSRILGIQLLA